MWTDPSAARPSWSGPGWRLPTQCEICRQWSRERFCSSCRSSYAPQLARCRRCALRLPVDTGSCGECLRNPPPFARCLCSVDYAFPWDRLIADFKFRGRPELAGPLSRMMLETLARVAPALAADAIVVPVPLSPTRLAERGYNQAWELARRLAAATGLRALPQGLERVVDTRQQADLGRAQRLLNLRAAFVVPPAARRAVEGRPVLLVDDVVTTGATAREAAATLMQAGVSQVDLWVLARTAAD